MIEKYTPEAPLDERLTQDFKTQEQANDIATKLSQRAQGIVENTRSVGEGEEWNTANYGLSHREMSPPGEIVEIDGIDNDPDSYMRIVTEDDSKYAPYTLEDREVVSLITGDAVRGQQILSVKDGRITELVGLSSGLQRIIPPKELEDGVDRKLVAEKLAIIRDKIAKIEIASK